MSGRMVVYYDPRGPLHLESLLCSAYETAIPLFVVRECLVLSHYRTSGALTCMSVPRDGTRGNLSFETRTAASALSFVNPDCFPPHFGERSILLGLSYARTIHSDKDWDFKRRIGGRYPGNEITSTAGQPPHPRSRVSM